MAAAVTISNDLSLSFTVASTSVSYAVIEAALIAAGFTSYRIERNVNPGSTDLVINLWPPTTPLTGLTIPFNAADALNRLATAASKFGG